MMALQIGKKPESDFNNPLGMLSDCHRRIERFLQILVTVAEQRRGQELSADEREALQTALRYFQIGAPKHTGDEEESLFPRLRAGKDDTVTTLLEKLERDHLEADQLHKEVDELGQRWLQDGTLAKEVSAKMIAALQQLMSIYQQHINLEDNRLIPAAAKILTPEEIREIGREMAARRDVKFQ
jgi:hemerythrin-like domain-containing protein